MKKNICIFGLIIVFVTQGCYKVTTIEVNNSPAIIKIVSFKTDIIPVFNKNCALSGCHGSGGHVPVLLGSNAFSTLTSGNYLNMANPSKSVLYLWLTGKEAVSMPMGAENNPSNINALVLAWITQGAKDN